MKRVENNRFFENAAYIWSDDSIRLIKTANENTKTLYLYVQEIGYFQSKKPYFTERKNLNSFLVLLTLSGEGELLYENKSYLVRENQAFFINCNSHHHYKTVSREPWEFIWIHFNGSQALGYYSEFVKNRFHILELVDRMNMELLMRRILSIQQKLDATSELITNNLLTNIITEFLLDTCTNSSILFIAPDYVKQARAYIEKHFRESLSLEMLADTCGISKYHFSREFKKYMGISVNEFLISTRISYGKGLLLYTSLSVNEIVFECGMSHVSHFIKLFKEREGMTPHAFRKQCLLS